MLLPRQRPWRLAMRPDPRYQPIDLYRAPRPLRWVERAGQVGEWLIVLALIGLALGAVVREVVG